MNKIKTILLASVTAFFFTACNDDTVINQCTQTEASIDNSKLADDENQYGYFGKYVEFGETVLTSRTWRLQTTNDGVAIDFFADGSADYQDKNTSENIDYGVSQDGTIIKLSDGGEIEYIKSFTEHHGFDANGNSIDTPCYLLNYVQRFGNEKVEVCATCIYTANGNMTCDL